MTDAQLVAISSLGGGVIGAGAAVLGTWLQLRRQAAWEHAKLVMGGAVEEYKVHAQLADARNGKLFPLSAYIFFHRQFLDELEKGSLDAAAVKRIQESYDRIVAEFKGAEKSDSKG